ncbi:MAG: hypothetical protein HC907_19895 [Richelia sp. SM1_7_0]|nr:hypothetical protein [Richelia sp. SM1_7_0]
MAINPKVQQRLHRQGDGMRQLLTAITLKPMSKMYAGLSMVLWQHRLKEFSLFLDCRESLDFPVPYSL